MQGLFKGFVLIMCSILDISKHAKKGFVVRVLPVFEEKIS